MADFNFQKYVNYFEALAISHQDLQHGVNGNAFYKGNAMQSHFIRSNGNNMKSAVFLLERLDTKPEDKNGDSVLLKRNGAFWILIGVGEIDNDLLETSAYDKAELIAQDFLAQMRFDKEKCIFLRTFDVNSADIMHVGPYGDNYFGVRCEYSFTTKSKNNLFRDQTVWL